MAGRAGWTALAVAAVGARPAFPGARMLMREEKGAMPLLLQLPRLLLLILVLLVCCTGSPRAVRYRNGTRACGDAGPRTLLKEALSSLGTPCSSELVKGLHVREGRL